MSYRSFEKICYLLLVVSFLATSMIPSGFMPGTKKSGYSITICSGMGFKEIFVPNGSGQLPEKETHSSPCAFAVNATYTQPSLKTFSIVVPVIVAANADNKSFIELRSRNFKPYLSQGPPVIFDV